MRILGIDPGTQFLGAGVVERQGCRVRHVAHALLTPKDFDTLPDKLAYLFDGLSEIIAAHRPDAVAVETVFHGKNARSALVLAHARGVALLAAVKSGLPVFEYAPSQVKRAVGASGSAPKEVVTRLVCALLGLTEVERADCADALAIALCHLNHSGLLYRPAEGFRITRQSDNARASALSRAQITIQRRAPASASTPSASQRAPAAIKRRDPP